MAAAETFMPSAFTLQSFFSLGTKFTCRSVVVASSVRFGHHHIATSGTFNHLVSYRWFQAEAGSTLFHVTKDPLDPTEFEETVDSNGNVVTGWGRSSAIEVTQTCATSAALDFSLERSEVVLVRLVLKRLM